jgi:hypothetical protein
MSLVSLGGPSLRATFDGPVITITGHQDSGLSVAGNDVDAAVSTTASVVVLTAEGFVSPGDTWSLNSQPAWCTTPLRFPLSGATG